MILWAALSADRAAQTGLPGRLAMPSSNGGIWQKSIPDIQQTTLPGALAQKTQLGTRGWQSKKIQNSSLVNNIAPLMDKLPKTGAYEPATVSGGILARLAGASCVVIQSLSGGEFIGLT